MIAVDTHVLIWGVKGCATANRSHMIPRAKQLIELSEKRKTVIAVPALVLSEFLVKYSPAQRAAVMASMSRRFHILPFDVKASSIAATLFADETAWKAARDESDSTKQRIKVDISILATVEAHKPSVFYVEDDPIQVLARRMSKYLSVKISPLPEAAISSSGEQSRFDY